MPQTTSLNPTELPLRDIHLPPEITWFPPAIGWWLLFCLLILSIVALIWLIKRQSRSRFRRLALQKLAQIEQDYQQQADDQQLLKDLSRLLRHAAQLHYPHAACAGLLGNDWLQFLDQQLGSREFSQGCGQPLATGPYRPAAEPVESGALLALCRRWLQHLPQAPKTERRGR